MGILMDGAGEDMLPNKECSGNSLLFTRSIVSLARYQTWARLNGSLCFWEARGGAGLWDRVPVPHSLQGTDARKTK